MRQSLLFCVLLVSCVGGDANAQPQVVMESIKASTLQGNVYIGPVHKGKIPYGPDQAISGVAVERCDAKFVTCKEETTTDVRGHFSIPSVAEPQGVYYLRFSLQGLNEHRVTVTVNSKAKPIALQMGIAA